MRKRSEPYLAGNIDKVNQFQQQILESIETYYNEKSKQNKYDITVEATIIDVSKKPEGIYRVRTNGAEFEAYSTSGSYYKNDIVLVSVPNGDYTNQKFILGRKADADENVTFAFKLPFDDFIGLKDLSKKQPIAGQYWANYPLTKENQADFLNTPIWEWVNTEDSTIGNTRLGIEADWLSLLGEYYPLRGTYGFRIIIKGVAASNELSPSTEIEREEYFTNRDMYGNTYAFYTPYNQQKVIDISDFLNVHSITIYYYQDFNFADSMNKYIVYDEYNADGRPAVPENLGFENVNVYLGVSAQDIKDETTFLYSYDSLGYSSKEVQIGDTHAFTFECGPEEEKDLIFAWVHYEKNGTFSVIKDIDDLIKQREATGKTTHIYWYRFNYDEDITDVEKIWKPEYSDLEKDWNDALNNPNYQTQIERYGGEGWTFLPYAIDNFNIKLMPRGNKSREKVKVVIQHDGTHTTSKELILNNLRDVEAELAGSSRNDKVVIKCFRLRQNVAIEDNSINTFHIYDENNKILYNDDNERFDEHPYYLQVRCRNDDTGLYEILNTVSDNDTSNGQQIAWSFPRQYTMIRSTEEVSIEDAKYFGIDATNEPIRFKNFHNSTIKFTINSIFNNRYSNNIVSAVIRQNDKEYHIERDLQFGRAEGLGHEFVPVIEILTPSGGTYLNIGQDFEIGCVVYKKDGTLYESPSLLTFSWREIGGKSTFCHYDDEGIQHDGYYISNYTGDDLGITNKYAGYRGNVIKGQLLSNGDITFPPIFEVTVYGAADYPLTIRKGFLICNNFSYKQKRNFYLPSRVEFKSDGANPIYYSDYFEVAELSIAADSSISDYQLEYPQWNINNNNIFELKSEITKRSFLELNSDTSSIQSKDHDYTRYKIQFVSTNPQWTEDLLKPINYTFIYYSVDGIYVAQSIAFDRNYYPSSLVNEWDGTSLTWDEENGAILSTMIAAGSKDGSNKFTGVMMGDWHVKGDESLDIPGLYGFNKGAQTFGLKTDGTGFIGSSGRGRIEFDGTEALISNADRSCYINLNPVNINNRLTDINNQSFSENFIYCKVNKTDNLFTSATDAINGKLSWAKPYFEDQNNDYFVVDPNYGVLTTGGVIARYGALGNWMISNEGLYQKTDNSYMYLGYDDMDVNQANSFSGIRNDVNDLKNNYDKNIHDTEQVNKDIATTESVIRLKEEEKPQKITEYQNKISTNNSTIELYRSAIQDIETQIELLNSQIDQKKEQIQNLSTEIKNNNSSISQKYLDINNKQNEIGQLNTKISEENDTLSENLVQISAKIQNVRNASNQNISNRQELSNYNDQYNILIKEQESLQAQYQQVTNDTSTLTEQIEQYNNQLDVISKEIEQINISYNNQHDKLTETLTNYHYLVYGERDYFDNSTTYTIDKEDNESQISLMQDENNNLENENNELQNQIDTSPDLTEDEIAQIENIISQNNEKINQNSEKINELIEKNNNLDKCIEYANQIETLNTSYREQINAKNIEYNEINDLKTNAENTILINNDTINSINNQLDNIDTSLQGLLNQLISLDETVNVNYEYLHQIYEGEGLIITDVYVYPDLDSSTIPEYLAEINDKITIIGEVSETEQNTFIYYIYNYLQNKYEELGGQDTNDTIKGYLEQIARLNEEITQLNNEIKALRNDIKVKENQKIVLNSEINNLKDEINTKETEKSNYTNKIYDLLNENNALNAAILKLDAEIIDLNQELDALKGELLNLQNSLTSIKNNINNIQNQIKNEYDKTFNVKLLDSSSTNQEINSVIQKLLNKINDLSFIYSTRYAIYASVHDPDQINGYPIFSVKWDGTMYARKGIIANTWEIDDYSLTYKKNNDIIYIGTQETRFSNNNYSSLGRAESLNDTRRWAISASSSYNKDNPNSPYLINFGVSLSGELYAQLGHIGGWSINNNQLTSTPASNGNYIILDSKNNIIKFSNGAFEVDGNTGTVKLGATYADGSEIGNVYLSSFLLSGRTLNTTISYNDYMLKGDDISTNRNISGVSDDYGWGSVNVGGTTIATYSNGLISNLNYSLDSSRTNYLQFLDRGHSDIGVVLATGNKTGSNNTATIFYPVQDHSVLGLQGHRWNLMAENIDANLINAGAVNGEKMYMKMELLATQVWVTNALADLWNAIADVSSQASDASRTGRSLSITGATWYGTYAGSGCYKLGIEFKRGNNSTFRSDQTGGALAGDAHYHSIKFSASGGKITLELGKPSGTGSTTSSFNIADTQFYKDHAYASESHSVSAESGLKYTVTVNIKSISNLTLDTKTIIVDASSAYNKGWSRGYDSGYNDGLKDAKCNKAHEGDRSPSGRSILKWVTIGGR